MLAHALLPNSNNSPIVDSYELKPKDLFYSAWLTATLFVSQPNTAAITTNTGLKHAAFINHLFRLLLWLLPLIFLWRPSRKQYQAKILMLSPLRIRQKLKSHINQLTRGSNEPIDIKKADNFVTADQLINLPEPSQSNQAALEEVTPEPVAEPSTSGAEANTFAVTSHLNVIGSRKPSTSTDTVQKIAELKWKPDKAARAIG